jgi:hypothetical protein
MNTEELIERLRLNDEIISEFSKIYDKAVASPYIRKPIAYTLYKLWRKWDAKEKPREVEE